MITGMDVICFFAFLSLNVLVYIVSCHMALVSEPEAMHLHMTILIYGMAQSMLGYITGIAVMKLAQPRSVALDGGVWT